MAEVTLKRKITLRTKQEQADFTFSDRLKVLMLWDSPTDMDLCLFYKKKDGDTGGIFSDRFRGKKSDLGSLDTFPFILHKGDEEAPEEGCSKKELILVKSLGDIEEAYICLLNYDAAVEGKEVTFAQESARVELRTDTPEQEPLEVPADSTDEGPVYYVCSIKNSNGKYLLKREDRVMDLGTAFDEIPGFALICN